MRVASFRSRSVLSLCLLLAVPATVPAAVTQCVGPAGVGLCTSVDGTGTCNVSAVTAVTPNQLIDCSGIDIRVKGPNGRLDVTNGVMKLRARNLIVESGRKLNANESATSFVGVDATLTGTLTMNGLITAKNAGGGSAITVVATGDINIDKSGTALETTGTAQSVGGGSITLTSSGSVWINGVVDADGKSCCGETNQNTGGRIEIDAGNDVTITKLVHSEGRFLEGGSVAVAATDDIIVSSQSGSTGEIRVFGHGTTGNGGEVLLAAGDRLEVRGPIAAPGGIGNGGGSAAGGTVQLTAGCGGLLVQGAIDLTGGSSGGGVLVAFSDGDAEVSSAIDASGVKDGGFGGNLDLNAAGLLTLKTGASLSAAGHTHTLPFYDGVGGFVDLSGCRVDVQSGSAIDVSGYFGGQIAIDGRRDGLPPPTPASGDFSVRVSQGSTLTATGDTAAQDGGIALYVTQQQSGVCINDATRACTLDMPTCTVGWQGYDCVFANPDTNGTLAQFQPAPHIAEIADTPSGCGGTCSGARAAGARSVRTTAASACTVDKYRGAAKFGDCVGLRLSKGAIDGLSLAQAKALAISECQPRLDRAFTRAGTCAGSATTIGTAMNDRIASYADVERTMFTPPVDLTAERRVIKRLGKIVRCELLVHSTSPGAPEESRLFRCRQDLLRRIISNDLGNTDGSIALAYLDRSGDAAAELLGPNGQCPERVVLTVHARNAAATPRTDDAFGWGGYQHHNDPIDLSTFALKLDCGAATPPSCGQCTVTGIDPTPGNCRCANDHRQICDQPVAADADDCGGAECVCNETPGQTIYEGSESRCVTRQFAEDVTGTWNVASGTGALNVALRNKVFLPVSNLHGCPSCVGDTLANDGVRDGVCQGGINDGQSCDASGFDASFPGGSAGPGGSPGSGYSHDCVLSAAQNLTGAGFVNRVLLTTGTASLTASVPCAAPLQAYNCHCRVCSGDVTVACKSNADCAAVGAGTCSGGTSVQPNGCPDLTCTSTGDGGGVCNAGPLREFCNAVSYSDGTPLLQCLNNGDCAEYGDCENGACGLCTDAANLRCFPNTISVTGAALPVHAVLTGVSCLPGSSSAGVNALMSIPGPEKIILDVTAIYD